MATIKKWLTANRFSILLLLLSAVIFFLAWSFVRPAPESPDAAAEYAEYETAKVTKILSDSTEADPVAEGAYRGEQLLLVDVTSGQYAGQTMQVRNYVGPLYSVPVSEGDGVTLIISTYADGSHMATVYEYNRIGALGWIVALFLLATVLIGGKTGAKSLIALLVTLASLFWILIPALLKGLPTLPTVFLLCAYITVVSLTIIGGVKKKTLCAMLGTIAGVAIAMLFGLFAQWIARIDGLRLTDVEPLLQIRQSGGAIGLRGLLVGGIIISALGAVMDVAMSIASALSEVKAANPSLGRWALFRSGMNIGRDMVGTMTNTLILAFLGSDFTLIIYLYTLGLDKYQLLSSPFLAIEVISGISSSIGLILAIPLTTLITSLILSAKAKNSKS